MTFQNQKKAADADKLAATGWDDDENNWWMKLAAYTYLADGKVGQIDFGNGVRTGYGYDGRGMIQIVDHYRPGLQDLSWRQYWRDERDRITAYQKSSNPGSNPMENGRGDRFAYDNDGELTDGWYNALDPAGNFNSWTRKDHFDYDALGNRQGDYNYLAGRNGGSTPVRFTRRDNGLNQYVHWWPAGLDYILYHDDNSPWPGYDGFPGNGVLMADGWLVASYNALNQPVAIGSFATWATGNWMYFGYDPLGRCVKRWAGDSGDVYSNPATYFHYDGWNLLQEGTNAWGPARVYVHGNRVDEIVWSYNTFTGEQAFHHYDARGHCTLLTDSTGNILEQYEYDAFGQPYFYDASGNSIGAYDPQGNWAGYSLFGNRFLFTGREWLADLKLYDYRNRLYQPELGRFMQPDPQEFAAGDYNLYRYCHNDPVNHVDPMGWEPIKISARLDELGIQASDNSLAASKDGYPRSQLIQETNGKLELQNKFNEPVAVKMPNNGSVVPAVMMEERAAPDQGSKTAGVGHVHKDLHGRPKPSESGFSKKDYERATGDKKKGLIGTPVWKVNESDPRHVDRLTPDTNPGEKPTIIRVR